VAQIAPAATGTLGEFAILLNWVINPADPGIFPSLAATSNQYQRFRTAGLRVTFTPASSTATDGMIYMAFQPDPTVAPPDNASDFMGLIGAVSSTVYGQPLVLNIGPHLLQQAYNSQIITKPQSSGETSTIAASGSLFVAISGVMDPKALGNLVFSYAYDLMNKQVTQGSNSISGLFDILSDHAEPSLTSYDGFQIITPASTPGTFKPRLTGAGHHLTLHLDTAALPTMSIADSEFADATWTTITPVSSVVGTAECHATYMLPPTRFWRLTHSVIPTGPVHTRGWCTSLPSRIPSHPVDY
jgi:hypothetical protein